MSPARSGSIQGLDFAWVSLSYRVLLFLLLTAAGLLLASAARVRRANLDFVEGCLSLCPSSIQSARVLRTPHIASIPRDHQRRQMHASSKQLIRR
ncbi:hypothetical protein TgHK011_001539 [Trichoderma gracile]|nr:hypothetical protein TgHK011_001539 [Trichoderma gracile]